MAGEGQLLLAVEGPDDVGMFQTVQQRPLVEQVVDLLAMGLLHALEDQLELASFD